jgi:hypothetical protein
MGIQAKGLKRARNRALLHGLEKHGDTLGPFSLDGMPSSVEALSAAVQAHLDALARIDTLHAELADAVRAERALETKTAGLVRAFKNHVIQTSGLDVVVLGRYGFKLPKKTGPKTNIAKVISAARMRATRKERGTMGKRQRKKGIKR